MRRHHIATIVVGLAACATDARFETLDPSRRPIVDPPGVVVMTLANGMHVAMLRDPRARIASVDLRYEVGASDDPMRHPGIALTLAHVLEAAPFSDRGAGRPADVELTTQLGVDLDRTELTATTLDLDGALELAARRLETKCDDLAPELVATARGQSLAQLSGMPTAFVAAIWGPTHPYAHSLGDPELERVTAPELCEFYTAHYAPETATLVVTGTLEPDTVARIRRRFEGISRGHTIARAPIPVIAPSPRLRSIVWGLAKPTAVVAFPAPAPGDQDDVTLDLAVRRLSWVPKLHVAVVGGRRGRAIVLGIEADSERELAHAHELLQDAFATALGGPIDDTTPDDPLFEAQQLDDPLKRGIAIADFVTSGRTPELLRRARAFAQTKNSRRWILDHLTTQPARMLDLIPARPGDGVSIDGLADPATSSERELPIANPEASLASARPLDRPISEDTLPNGLRVVLAPDPQATTVDIRLVFPFGSNDETTRGVAVLAAAELEADDGFHAGPTAQDRLRWYATVAFHADTDITAVSTRFRTVGLASLADWHVFALAWHVTTGHEAHFEPGRFARHYAPAGATLIVSGGFDPAALHKTIVTWFGPWRAPSSPPPRAAQPLPLPAPVLKEQADAQIAELWLGYERAPEVDRATGMLLATAIRDRLTDLTHATATTAVTYDPRDGKLAISTQLDVLTAAETAHVIDAELAKLRDSIAPYELARARRHAIAAALTAEVGPSGRARWLEDAVVTRAQLRGDPTIDQLREVSADSLQAAARATLVTAKRTIAIRAPKPALVLSALAR